MWSIRDEKSCFETFKIIDYDYFIAGCEENANFFSNILNTIIYSLVNISK